MGWRAASSTGSSSATQLYDAMCEVKQLFDPDALMNPGKIVNAPPMTENIRDVALPAAPALSTRLSFVATGGMRGAADRCMNIGVCRKGSTGVMCPSYMATREEEHSTRGRANALVHALSQPDPRAALGDDRLHDILDLCLECKACKSECPLGVDMASMKSEFLFQYQGIHGVPARARFFAGRAPAEPTGIEARAVLQPGRVAARIACADGAHVGGDAAAAAPTIPPAHAASLERAAANRSNLGVSRTGGDARQLVHHIQRAGRGHRGSGVARDGGMGGGPDRRSLLWSSRHIQGAPRRGSAPCAGDDRSCRRARSGGGVHRRGRTIVHPHAGRGAPGPATGQRRREGGGGAGPARRRADPRGHRRRTPAHGSGLTAGRPAFPLPRSLPPEGACGNRGDRRACCPGSPVPRWSSSMPVAAAWPGHSDSSPSTTTSRWRSAGCASSRRSARRTATR